MGFVTVEEYHYFPQMPQTSRIERRVFPRVQDTLEPVVFRQESSAHSREDEVIQESGGDSQKEEFRWGSDARQQRAQEAEVSTSQTQRGQAGPLPFLFPTIVPESFEFIM